jgi:hypothetical protein
VGTLLRAHNSAPKTWCADCIPTYYTVLCCPVHPLQLAGQLRSLHKLPVGYVALDWHQMDKELGSEALVEAFWTQLSALLPPQVGWGNRGGGWRRAQSCCYQGRFGGWTVRLLELLCSPQPSVEPPASCTSQAHPRSRQLCSHPRCPVK